MSEYLTLKEVAEMLHYTERYARQMCIDGKIPGARKVGGGRKWLIPADAPAGAGVSNEFSEILSHVSGDKEKHYQETAHKQKMQELAKELAGKVSLPSLWEKDSWPDLPVEFQPGNYQLPIGAVEISRDKIKVNYYDISAGIAEPHLVKALYCHLSTCRLSKFTELVGDKGKLDNWVGVVGQYYEALMTFLKLITDEVKGYRAKVSFHYEVKPGLTKWFIIIAWNDAIERATGHSWIDDSWYKPHESIPNTNLWQLKCGAYSIGIARSERTLKMYENWHKKLRAKYAEHPLAKDIAAGSQELSNIAHDIQQLLQEFSDMQHLPGHCELC